MLLNYLTTASYLYNKLSKSGWIKFITKYKKLERKGKIDQQVIYRLQTLIKESNNAEWIYNFAKSFKDANISLLTNAIIETEDENYICKFCCDIKGVDYDKLSSRLKETFFNYIKQKGVLTDAIIYNVIFTDNSNIVLYLLNNINCAKNKEITDFIISKKEPNLILELALQEGADIERLQDLIIQLGQPYYICCFALQVKNANIIKLQEAIVKIANNYYITYFVNNVKGIDKKKFIAAMIKTKNCAVIYNLAFYDSFDIAILQEAIIKIANAEYIYYFVQNVKGADIEKLTNAIINTNNLDYIIKFAQNVKGADIIKLQKAIIRSGNIEAIYQFAKDVKGADIEELTEVIVNTNNSYYITKFALNVKGANIIKLTEVIIALGDANCICELAIYVGLNKVECIDLDNLTDAIISTNNQKCILQYIKNVKNLSNRSMNKLIKAVCEANNYEAIYYIITNYNELEQKSKKLLVSFVSNPESTKYSLAKPADTYACAYFSSNLSNEDENNLIDSICQVCDKNYFSAFARDVAWLNEEHKSKLIQTVCKQGDSNYICWFANNIDWLTQKDKSNLVKGVIATNDFLAICYFAYNVEGLTETDYNRLNFAINTLNTSRICEEIRSNGAVMKKMTLALLTALGSINTSVNNLSYQVCVGMDMIIDSMQGVKNTIKDSRSYKFH